MKLLINILVKALGADGLTDTLNAAGILGSDSLPSVY